MPSLSCGMHAGLIKAIYNDVNLPGHRSFFFYNTALNMKNEKYFSSAAVSKAGDNSNILLPPRLLINTLILVNFKVFLVNFRVLINNLTTFINSRTNVAISSQYTLNKTQF